MARKYLDTTGLTALWAKIKGLFNSLATVATTGSYNDLTNKPTVAEIDDSSTANNKAWSANNINSKLNNPVTFRTDDIPEKAENLSNTATAHRITAYQNGLSIPYQMDNTNDGGILRVRGTSESNCILELGTWDDSGSGETIQFNYYPTTSQVTPTYSVSVPKKSGTIALTSDVDDKVSKSGDTMSGALTMNNVDMVVKDTDIKLGTTPSSNIWGNGYYFQTNDGTSLGYLREVQDTSNKAGLQLEIQRTISNTRHYHYLTMKIDGNGSNSVEMSDQAAWRSAIGHPFVWDINTNNTSDTWVPVLTGSTLQHRVIPRTIDGTSSVGFTRSHASVSYKEGLVCNRFGNVVTFAGYFSCGATIGANTALYSGLPKPAGGKAIYFTWSGYDFYLHATDGSIRTNGQIVSRTYVGTFTYVCA